MNEQATVGGWHPDIDVREVRLGDSLTILIPEPWAVERLEDGRWWCGDEAAGESAIVDAGLAAPRKGTPPDATPRQAAKAYLDYFHEFLEGVEGIVRIEAETTPTDYLLRAEGSYVEDDRRFEERRWYLFRGVEDSVAVLRMALHVRQPVLDRRRFEALAELFARQIRAAHGRLREPAGAEVEGLQDFIMDGLVSLRLPARWTCRQEGEDWYCCDPDGRPGRLWAGYDLFRPSDVSDADGGSAAMRLAQEFGDSWQPGGSRVLARHVFPAPLGAILHLVDEDADDGNGDPKDLPLRCYRWIYFAPRGGAPGVMSRYTLMLPMALADQPELQDLVRLIGAEVGRQRLEEDAAA